MDKTQELQQRIERVNYLVKKAESVAEVNPEQAEAYIARVNQHKPRILNLLKLLEERKDNDELLR